MGKHISQCGAGDLATRNRVVVYANSSGSRAVMIFWGDHRSLVVTSNLRGAEF
jgi:hypothetical protein